MSIQPIRVDEEIRHPLDAFFMPRAVAVIGATDKLDSVGRTVLWNLISNPFGGTVYAVNPNRHQVLGMLAYPDIGSIPEPIDLAIIITPAQTVPNIIKECIRCSVKGCIIISAGFSETGEAGKALEEEIKNIIYPNKIRVIGPNSLGIMNPIIGLNSAFAPHIASKGTVGFITQSGAVGAAILDWSFHVKVGFSKFVSFGTMVDVNWADLIYYLGDDPYTKSIVIYMQALGDVRSFLSAAREVALHKPIILLKGGRTELGAKLARNTPYYVGGEQCSDEVFSAALKRCGVLRVDNIQQLFDMAIVLGKQPRPKGNRLAIISNAAGPSILATDALVSMGGKIASLSEKTMEELNQILPPYWNHDNPIDLLANADPKRYAQSAEIVLKDENADGLLVILTPQVMTKPLETAEELIKVKNPMKKPILASWMGGYKVEDGQQALNNAGIPTLDYPDIAARIFLSMWHYSYQLKGLYETPSAHEETSEHLSNKILAKNTIEYAVRQGQSILPPSATRDVLASYGINLIETHIAHDETEAVHIAKNIGYPVVLRRVLLSGKVSADPGGVLLNLHDEKAVRKAFRSLLDFVTDGKEACAFPGIAVQPLVPRDGIEICIGSHVDPLFGPYIYFCSGGKMLSIFEDRATGLPPLNTTLARRMIEDTNIYKSLKEGKICKGFNLEELERLLVQFSYLICEQRLIQGMELNPIVISPKRIVALNASILLYPIDTPIESFPKLAIRPYPNEYTFSWTSRKGNEIILRPIRPEDESLMIRFHETLSDNTVYFRYFQLQPLHVRTQHERLTEICFVDYDRSIALVAVEKNKETGENAILGVGRIVKIYGTQDAEFALMISDLFQGHGLGTEMLRRLIQIARTEGVHRLYGTILPENRAMLRVCAKLGFVLKKPTGQEFIAELILN
ncbi:MAG TPA: bifunctional acetate--CoA ligase family protein/GNAT family N-acetyltransferase [Candidatus Hydrogenedens sp.]|nr:bifunctional acetate--CoA ligase family protein/GNAT family N-acetyltransferase [Candidatus Hydrogenedens sp.]HOK08373.1 bifunctional acetate--CoA ligase family protein/GNAT family N-acetyltransferase [Candidatus Hydrogenedens sp.]HOL20577.1 bifunctional acetate--CoA ligase family protein/GNAT family N-acetyltransferase [Candidatus Hydrogenedens sp.]HPP57667.1 bifunctional acetate--CoA ligase family protein/GNAT family N-acetyltransferase [Candidatus Hydrogenedens sp.]